MGDPAVTNRELAGLVVIAALLVAVLASPSRRTVFAPLGSLLRTIASPSFLIPLALYICWLLASLLPARRIGLWDPSLWKPVVLWMTLSGLRLLIGVNDATSGPGYFRRAFIGAIGVSAVVESLAASSSFPLLIEIPAQVLAFVFACIAAVARRPDQRSAKRFAITYLVLFGVAALVWSAVDIVRDWSNLDKGSLLRQLALPVWLTPVALAFVYALAVWMAHRVAGSRLRIWNKGSTWRQRLAIVVRCNARLGSLRALQGQTLPALAKASSFAEAWRAIGEGQRRVREEAVEEKAKRQRLVSNAGLLGVDEHGQQLDQRGFEETREALRWLATCQMGQHNATGKYQRGVVDVAAPTLVQDDPPEGHGLELHVSDDGQRWYAYRQTPSGWFFGIGAAEGTPDQWLFDGEQAPTTFPDERGWDHFAPGIHSVNWD